MCPPVTPHFVFRSAVLEAAVEGCSAGAADGVPTLPLPAWNSACDSVMTLMVFTHHPHAMRQVQS